MTDCPIFAAAAYIEQTWKEADRLADAVIAGLNDARVGAAYSTYEAHDDDHAGGRTLYVYRLNPQGRRRRPGQLCIYFDLCRPTSGGAWKHARSAIVMFAYAPNPDSAWDISYLTVDQDGLFTHPDSRSYLRAAHSPHDRRLLIEHEGAGPIDVSKTAWLFGVELSQLTNRAVLDTEILQPILGMLRPGAGPAAPRNSWIDWPSPPAGRAAASAASD